MIGYFVYHPALKIGKVVRADASLCAVHFYQEGEERLFDRHAIRDGELTRCYLPLDTPCDAAERGCRIEQIADGIRERQPVLYQVTTDDGLQLRVSEVDLVPREIVREDPAASLAGLQQEGYPLFAARSELVAAHAEVVRQGGGLTALLSSRIDVRPHQAYVAGVVLQDRVRRYILADEVGLGKTIEAGVIVQDLLSSRPNARVLILCPGALTQQWLCELYTKFSSRVFTLLDLHPNPVALSPAQRRTVIAPMHAVAGPHRGWLQECAWDLVVVDEVHHLLVSRESYAFVKAMSSRVPSILLLSALPAQQRKTEFLRLLALLEPGRYDGTVPEEFDRLYDAQADIGRQLRRLRRRLGEADADPGEIREIVERVASTPALADDLLLQSQAAAVRSPTSDAVLSGRTFLQLAADRSRINRRILRNRRSRLVEDGLIDRTVRVHLPDAYEPGQPELDALRAAIRLVRALATRVERDLWSAFSRVLMQSFAHPETAVELAAAFARPASSSPPASPESLGHLAGSVGWPSYRDGLLAAVRPHAGAGDVRDLLDAVRTWRDSVSGLARVEESIEFLERLERKHKKIVIFAGYPGLVEHLLPPLREAFEPESTCVFRADMDRAEKEENVARFRTDPEAWLLVCDESGGEGRNFQFAGAVVHFDTPWYVSRVEQRIGRLDRLGRLAPEVPTAVLYARGTPEEDLVRCYAEGFRVYQRSVSGLEFALRELELDLVRSLLGPEARPVEEFLGDLRDRVEQERTQEENEAVLDEASFNREAAERYRRGHSLAEAEERIERAFTEFVRKVANFESAQARYDREFPTGLWEFDATQFRHIKFEPTDRAGGRPAAGPLRGTFRRRIAQERLDLQFFSVGHPLFDGVMTAVREQQCGRTYAIDISSPSRPEWHGFELVLVAHPDHGPLQDNRGLLAQATRLFTAPPLHVFINAHGECDLSGDDLLRLRRGLEHRDKDRTWWNLTKQKAVRATLPFGGQDAWGAALQRAVAVAREHARRVFAERLNPDISAALAAVEDQATLTRCDAAERSGLDRLARAIRGWSVSIDAAGFLSINGKLGRPA